jgi:hypothetical protein
MQIHCLAILEQHQKVFRYATGIKFYKILGMYFDLRIDRITERFRISYNEKPHVFQRSPYIERTVIPRNVEP